MDNMSDVGVAISGIGGYFPSSDNVEDFEKLLFDNVDMVEAAKWTSETVEEMSGNLKNIAGFDTHFFGIVTKQAKDIAPAHKLILESAFQAIVDAGKNPAEIRGKRIAVYMGTCVKEDESEMTDVHRGYYLTGHANSLVANRISYFFGFTGESGVYDASWNNGVKVIQMAMESILTGQCEAAMVGVANLVTKRTVAWLYRELGLTSKKGKTKPFDDDGDGYCRSDSVIVLYLEKENVAKRIYATVLKADCKFFGNCDGHFMKIKEHTLVKFLDEFYKNANTDPKTVEYVEAYGCGRKEIDEVELNALEKIFCKNREYSLLVGSVKSNCGHTEAASAIMGVIKVILAMNAEEIPANLHYKKGNVNISALHNGKIQVVTKNTKWRGDIAAVNSIGFLNSFGHILLRSNPRKIVRDEIKIPLLNIFSSRTSESITEVIESAKSKPMDPEYLRLCHDVFAKNIPNYFYRGYLLKGSELKEETAHFSGSKRPVWFVYSGMGSQWTKMGKELMALPVFAESIKKCHNILVPMGVDLIKIITDDDPTLIENITHSFIGITAIQIALTDVLRSINIHPDGIVGHSAGELACAYGDNCLTAEQIILSVYYRGKTSQELKLIKGMMASVGIGYQNLKHFCPPSIDIACHNSPDNCTISGPADDVSEFVETLKKKGVFAKTVNVSNIAFHGRHIRPVAPILVELLKKVIPNPMKRSSKWISTSVPESEWGSDLHKYCSAEYFTNNLLSSVYFEEGLVHVPKDAIVLELAPRGLLLSILKRCLPKCEVISITKRDTPNRLEYLFGALAKCYLNGIDMNLSALYPEVSFPVSRGARSLAPLVRWDHETVWHSGVDSTTGDVTSEKFYNIRSTEIAGHVIDGRIMLPISTCLKFISDLASETTGITFEEILVQEVTEVPVDGVLPVRLMLQKGSGNFEISTEDDVIMSGRMTTFSDLTIHAKVPIVNTVEDDVNLDHSDFYKELKYRGYNYKDTFKLVQALNISTEGSIALIRWKNNWQQFINSMIQVYLFHAGENNQNLIMPKTIRQISINFEELPEFEKDVEVLYHYNSGLMVARGIEIQGLKFVPLMPKPRIYLLNRINFLNLFDEYIEDLQVGINMFLQVIFDSTTSLIKKSVVISQLLDKNNEDLESLIKSQLKNFSEVKASITSSQQFDHDYFPHSLIILADYTKVKDYLESLQTYGNYLIVRVENNQKLLNNEKLNIISSFSCNYHRYYLFKQTVEYTTKFINISSENLRAEDVILGKEKWFSEFQSIMQEIKCQPNSRLYLVSNSEPVLGVINFINEIKSKCNYDKLRFLFLLNKTPNNFTKREDFNEVIQRDLLHSVLGKNGQWGLYTSLTGDISTDVIQKSDINSKLLQGTIRNCKIEYLDVGNLRHDENEEDSAIKFVNYSGTNASGQRVMGVGMVTNEGNFAPDAQFVFQIPEYLTLENAATIPYAYIMAYYILVEIAQVNQGDTVLINGGSTSVGQALISIASNKYNCKIVTSVYSQEQKDKLLESLSLVDAFNIFLCNDPNLELKILYENPEGVDIVINCLPGDNVSSIKRCLHKLGRFIHFGINGNHKYESTGLSVFLTILSMYGVTAKSIFYMSPGMKKKIYKMITEGIEDGDVYPLQRKVYNTFDTEAINSHLANNTTMDTAIVRVSRKENLNKPLTTENSEYKCDEKASYLIFGDSPDQWIEVCQWLINRGARKLVIATNSNKQTNYINRRLVLFQEHFNATIILNNSDINLLKDATKFLQEVEMLSPLGLVIILPGTDFRKIQLIDEALQDVAPIAHLLCLLGRYSDVFYTRINSSRISNVKWEDQRTLLDVLSILDQVLLSRLNTNVVLKNVQDILKIETVGTKISEAMALLPDTFRTVMEVIRSNFEDEILVQLPSLSHPSVKDITPLFIIPGVLGHYCPILKELSKKLLHPVYCVNLSKNFGNFEEQASIIAKVITETFHQNSYNIVGISLGGALALEIVKIFVKNGIKYRLCLVDGDPKTITTVVRRYENEVKSEDLLVQKLMNNQNISTSKNLKNFTPSIKKAASILNCRFKNVATYKPPPTKIDGSVYLVKSNQSSKIYTSDLANCCSQLEIKIMDGDHVTTMQSQELFDFINDFASIHYPVY